MNTLGILTPHCSTAICVIIAICGMPTVLSMANSISRKYGLLLVLPAVCSMR